MTRVWAAAVLAAAILTLSITEYRLCRSTSEQLLQIAQQIENTAQSDDAYDECVRMQELWNKRKTALELFINHSAADDIDNSLESMKRYAELDDYERLYAECGVLKNRLYSVSESEEINPHNIF